MESPAGLTSECAVPPGGRAAALAAIVLASFLASLDNNIVVTALPTITSDLGGVRDYTWVSTAYLLAAAISVPVIGKLGDLTGRKRLFQISLATFLAGSALSGASTSIVSLTAFRALQGIGGGGLVVTAMASFAELFTPEDRGRYQGYFAGVLAVSTVGGPVLGGAIADGPGWRWIFYLNLPLGAVALVLAAAKMRLASPAAPAEGPKPAIDFPGALLLGAWVTALVLTGAWGGSRYAWTSPAMLTLCASMAVVFTIWLLAERRAAEPIVPLDLFRRPLLSLSVAATFLSGFALFGGLVFVPLYFQTVAGASASNSGLLLLPFALGVLLVSITARSVLTRVPAYGLICLIAMAISAAGMLLLASMNTGTPLALAAAYTVLVGVGFGLGMQVLTLAVQLEAPPRDLGAASSVVTSARQIGGSLGLAVLGGIFTANLSRQLHLRNIPAAVSTSPTSIRHLDPPVRAAVQASYAHALRPAFLAAGLLLALATILMLPVTRRRTPAGTGEQSARQPEAPHASST
jgi:EmrB/QacA subfamily drug resistance transporter